MKPGNYMAFAAILLSSISVYGDYYPDDEIKEALNYRTLPKCGNPHVRSAPKVSVTEWRYFDGDTNRSEFAAGLDHWEIGFATNAINELVAYPEADLPD